MRKFCRTLILQCLFLLLFTVPSLAKGWVQDEVGWWYDNGDGTYPVNQVVKIGTASYGFNESGYMVTGWNQYGFDWYFFNPDGSMCKRWQQVNGKWYYLGTDGIMCTGWLDVGSKTYYLDENGAMKSGSFEADGVWYQTDSSGALIKKAGTADKKNAKPGDLSTDSSGAIIVYSENNEWEYLYSSETTITMLEDSLSLEYSNRYHNAWVNKVWNKLKGLRSDQAIQDFIKECEEENDYEGYLLGYYD